MADITDNALANAAELQRLQIEWVEAVTARQKAEQEILRSQILNASTMDDVRQKRWLYNCRVNQHLSFLRQMRVCQDKMQCFKRDLVMISFVVELKPEFVGRIWQAWRRVSRMVPASWGQQMADETRTNVQFILDCMSMTPVVSSDDHMRLIRCMGVCDNVVSDLLVKMDSLFERLQASQINVWDDAAIIKI